MRSKRDAEPTAAGGAGRWRPPVLAIPLVLFLSALAAGEPPAPELDPVFFEDVVLPVLDAACATSGCHGSPGAGRLLIETGGLSIQARRRAVERNLRSVLQFVRPGDPDGSRLLRKPLRRRDGGLPHAGGGYRLAKGSETYRVLADWILGQRLEGVAPIADAGPGLVAKPGEAVRLDGRQSRDRRGMPLVYTWRLVQRPDGAAAVLKESETATPLFRGDRPGVYAFELTVSNGDVESAPATTTVVVDERPFWRREAERFGDVRGFFVEEDPQASGGALLRCAQETSSELPARARQRLRLPAAGPYRVVLRVRTSGEERDRLEVSLDGAPPCILDAAGPPGLHTVALEPVASDASGLPPGVARLSGVTCVRGGRLELHGSADRPVRVRLESEGEVPTRRVALRVAFAGRGGALEVRLGDGDRSAALRVDPDAGDWTLLESRGDGSGRVLARRVARFDESARIGFEVAVEGRRVFLLPEGGEVLEGRLGAPLDPVSLELASWGVWYVSEVRMLAGDGAARNVPLDAESVPAGWLEAGDHELELIAQGSDVPAVDEVLILRSDLGAARGDEARRVVQAVFVDLLGRTPTDMERMLAAGEERAALVRRLAGSLDFWRAWYESELYYFLLIDNFRPRRPSMDQIPVRLSNGSLDVRSAIQQIVISQDFNARNPGNDTFVSVVLEQLLGITVQEEPRVLAAGKRMYDGYAATLFGRRGSSQADFVRIVVEDPRFAPFLLARRYRAIFGADPRAEDLERWARRFEESPHSYPDIVAEWLASPAYDEVLLRPRRKSDAVWIRSLFVELLGREPSREEYRNFRNALQALSDSTPLRSVLAQVVLDSGRVPLPSKEGLDADSFVEEWFLRLLARRPTDHERSVFRQALEEEDGSPALVLHALLASDEYQYYGIRRPGGER